MSQADSLHVRSIVEILKDAQLDERNRVQREFLLSEKHYPQHAIIVNDRKLPLQLDAKDTGFCEFSA